MISIKKKLWRVWYFLRKLIWKEEIPKFAKYVSEVPENLENKFVYIIGENNYQWFAVLKCPCNCGDNIHLNLLEDSTPVWKTEDHSDGTITLKPSVWSLKGCQSHYFVRNGKIKWC